MEPTEPPIKSGLFTTENVQALVAQAIALFVSLKMVTPADGTTLASAITGAIVAIGAMLASAAVVWKYIQGRVELKKTAVEATPAVIVAQAQAEATVTVARAKVGLPDAAPKSLLPVAAKSSIPAVGGVAGVVAVALIAFFFFFLTRPAAAQPINYRMDFVVETIRHKDVEGLPDLVPIVNGYVPFVVINTDLKTGIKETTFNYLKRQQFTTGMVYTKIDTLRVSERRGDGPELEASTSDVFVPRKKK